MKVSIYDVAKKSGLSVVTVSRVLNNAPTVKASSREKVMKAVEALNYQPSAAARSLAKGKTNVIGLVLPNLSDSFLSDVVQETDLALAKMGYSLAISIIDTSEFDSSERKNFFFQQDRVDGVLVLTPLFEDEYVRVLQKRSIPFVFMDNQNYPYTVPSVVIDNFKGGYDATHCLLEAGHDRIAHIGGPLELLSAEERCSGFKKALDEMGLVPFDIARGDFDVENGFSTMVRWIQSGNIPTAVFAGDDNIAFGAIDALRCHGLSVPEDVSIVGYDDHPFCSQLHPFLTSVKQPAIEMAREGVNMLMDIMKGDLKRTRVIKLNPQIVKRNSVKIR